MMNDKLKAGKPKKLKAVNEKKKKSKKNESEDDLEESSEEELDLTKECHPIGHYINDKAEMIDQMFSVIKGNKLRAMLPPILKDSDVDELKLHCLDQLLGMSEKRISCILEGEILETSSESEVESDNERDKNSASDSNTGSEYEELSEKESSHKNSDYSRKRKINSKHDHENTKVPKVDPTAPAPEQGKTLLEILELEMRARAIRALLSQGGDKESKNVQNNAGEGDVVDLTNCEDDEDFPLPPAKKENPSEVDIEKKVSNFEMKIEKTKETEKIKPITNDPAKKQKLQAELELRNKFFKKNIYRTRQQRMENEEKDDDNTQEIKDKNESTSESNKKDIEEPEMESIIIKKEPPEEIVIEDPEEGEISSEEEERPVQVKQEKIDKPEKKDVDEDATKVNDKVVTASVVSEEINADRDQADILPEITPKEVVAAVASESALLDDAKEQITVQITESSAPEEIAAREIPTCEYQEPLENSEAIAVEAQGQETEEVLENHSWLGRWLQNDDVQKIVKSSKICAKVKRKLKVNKKQKDERLQNEIEATDSNSLPARPDVIEGSVEEYQRLVGKTIEKDKNIGKQENSNHSEKETQLDEEQSALQNS